MFVWGYWFRGDVVYYGGERMMLFGYLRKILVIFYLYIRSKEEISILDEI